MHTFQLMLEKEQSYVDKLRSELAKAGAGAGSVNSVTPLQAELAGAERRVRTLHDQLAAITTSDQVASFRISYSTFRCWNAAKKNLSFFTRFIQLVLVFFSHRCGFGQSEINKKSTYFVSRNISTERLSIENLPCG